jgi:hypothetical protein
VVVKVYVQCAMDVPQKPEELQQSPNGEPLQTYLFVPPHDPSGLMMPVPGVGVGVDVGELVTGLPPAEGQGNT